MNAVLIFLAIHSLVGCIMGKLWKGRALAGALFGLAGPFGLIIICFLPKHFDQAKLLGKITPAAWWYTSKAQQLVGPFNANQLAEQIEKGIIERTTMVWHEGMAGWIPAAATTDLRGLFKFHNRRAYQANWQGALCFWGGIVIGLFSLYSYQENLRLAIAGQRAVGVVTGVEPQLKSGTIIRFRVPATNTHHEDWAGSYTNLMPGQRIEVWQLSGDPEVCRLSRSPLSRHFYFLIFASGMLAFGFRRVADDDGSTIADAVGLP